MKQQRIVLCVSLLIIFSCLLSACRTDRLDESIFPSEGDTDSPPEEVTDYAAAIRDLENRIIELQQNQYISDAEYEKELSSLLSRLESLKAESTDKTPENSDKNEENTSPEEKPNDIPTASPLFLYTVADGLATITGYTGSESHVVIPSAIDGHTVHAIGEGAFSSDKIRSVLISDGVRSIDWFAFRDCPNLSAVTVPKSVTSIGYEAFGMRDSTFTLYCHSDSFAQTYAKSYGLTYATI